MIRDPGARRTAHTPLTAALVMLLVLAHVPPSRAAVAVADSVPARWAAWAPLLGEWRGEGSGTPGRGSGGFVFALDLQGRVLVRRSFAEYPASATRPPFRHDDLTVAHREGEDGPVRALYLDNEGHVIPYTARVSAARDTFVLVSDPQPAAPRYRLSYVMAGPDDLRLRFEVAPPGSPDAFATYLDAGARRVRR
jgi:hypothetical protein